MNQLTSNEIDKLKDIVSITTTTGTIYYLSEVSRISKDSFVYSGKTINVGSPEAIQRLIEAKDKYEAYKLVNSSTSIEAEIDKYMQQVVHDKFATILADTTSDLKLVTDQLVSTVQESKTDISNMSEYVTSATNKINSLQSTITSAINSIKLDDVHQLVADIKNVIQPARTELTSIVAKLKELF